VASRVGDVTIGNIRRGSPALDANTRLRIATRIHFALRRHLGEGVDVAMMLKNEDYAREALWVCEALGDADLATLARQYRGDPASAGALRA
jgi:hypothetical protein